MKNDAPRSWACLKSSVGLALVTTALLVDSLAVEGRESQHERANSYASQVADRVFADSVTPRWLGDDDSDFWYRVSVGPDAHRFILVDCEAGTRRDAFDHRALADALSDQIGNEVKPDRLDLRSLRFDLDDSQCSFRLAGKSWAFTLPDGPLVEASTEFAESESVGLRSEPRIARSRGGGERTPIRFENRLDVDLDYFWVMGDGQLRHYGRVAAGKSVEVQTYVGHAWLLKDELDRPVASFVASSSESLAVVDEATIPPRGRRDSSRRAGRRERTSPDGRWDVILRGDRLTIVDVETESSTELALPLLEEDEVEGKRFGERVWWSPDSRHFVVMQVVPGENRTIHLIESSPKDSIHARLLEVPYAKPGDRIDHSRPVLVSLSDEWNARSIDDSEFPNPFDVRELSWDPDGQSFSFLYNERGHQRLRLITVDAESRTPRITIDETSETFICYSQKSFLHRVEGSGEWIWMSERDGWNHLYLIDAETGEVKNQITSGNWVVRGVERVEDQDRRLYVKVSGIDADQDPYHVHLIRVNFDGTDPVRLTEGDGDHRWRFSPNDRFLVDTYSRVDLPPVTELREVASGRKICELERADISSLLETGWQPPERFVAKGRDGRTDIHGIIVRPTNFDADQCYPVLEQIYAGPHSSFVPKRFGLHRELYEMAELGFIVVKIDGMGTSNRSKAFHDVCWKNLGDSGFPDRIAWIRAAAAVHPEMDLSRVGIWGGSAGGQSALRALIAHGDFYHAAVADCGCHDNRVDKIWWNEQWMGWPVGPHYEEQSNATQAHRLQGDLMLIWGELDRNVDPSSTLQVIDALIKADKDFEQLIIPGSGHGAAGHPYAKRRQAEFFLRKLKN
jgi:dipeptidyl aminopeptidase/acylaminoacyl peptidase